MERGREGEKGGEGRGEKKRREGRKVEKGKLFKVKIVV